jgi:hypothetical protein
MVELDLLTGDVRVTQNLYYTTGNASGTKYCNSGEKFVFRIDSLLYVRGPGATVSGSAINWRNGDGEPTGSSVAGYYTVSHTFYPVITTTQTAIGLPASITGPLVLKVE